MGTIKHGEASFFVPTVKCGAELNFMIKGLELLAEEYPENVEVGICTNDDNFRNNLS